MAPEERFELPIAVLETAALGQAKLHQQKERNGGARRCSLTFDRPRLIDLTIPIHGCRYSAPANVVFGVRVELSSLESGLQLPTHTDGLIVPASCVLLGLPKPRVPIRAKLAAPAGFEPAPPLIQGGALSRRAPGQLVAGAGFEPTTFCL